MKEFGALIEERRVVFVAFDNEGPPLGTHARRMGKIQWEAADEISGVDAGTRQQVSGNSGGGRLAVGTRDDDGPSLT